MPVMPWIENSSRTLLGRLFSCTTTASNPPPPVNFPVRRSDCSACMWAMPPDAWMYLAIRLSAVWAESGAAHNASAATFDSVLRMIIPPELRRGGTTKLSAGGRLATRLDLLDVTDDAVPIEVGLDCAASRRAQPVSQCGVSKQTVESLSHRRRTVRIDQESRFTLANGVDQTSLSSRQHGDAGRGGLHHGDPEALYEQVVAP